MAITLGGVVLDRSLYLDKRNSAPLNSVQSMVTVDGMSYIISKPYFGGRELSLRSMNQSGSLMGLWCQYQIDDLKILEQNSQSVTLDYHGETFDVLIQKIDLDSPLHHNQEEGPNKIFTGEITLMEVG